MTKKENKILFDKAISEGKTAKEARILLKESNPKRYLPIKTRIKILLTGKIPQNPYK